MFWHFVKFYHRKVLVACVKSPYWKTALIPSVLFGIGFFLDYAASGDWDKPLEQLQRRLIYGAIPAGLYLAWFYLKSYVSAMIHTNVNDISAPEYEFRIVPEVVKSMPLAGLASPAVRSPAQQSSAGGKNEFIHWNRRELSNGLGIAVRNCSTNPFDLAIWAEDFRIWSPENTDFLNVRQKTIIVRSERGLNPSNDWLDSENVVLVRSGNPEKITFGSQHAHIGPLDQNGIYIIGLIFKIRGQEDFHGEVFVNHMRGNKPRFVDDPRNAKD